MAKDPKSFAGIGFEDFRKLASDKGLSKYERIGFPDSYRQGHEKAIFRDIESKLPRLYGKACRVMDIGPGCSDLPMMLIKRCRQKGHALDLVDSAEMLEHLPDAGFIKKTPALFPHCPALLKRLKGKVDVVLAYSVLHYVIVDAPLFVFWDALLSLLAPGGRCLMGDIPNLSQRKRFFASASGVQFHQRFMRTQQRPKLEYNRLEPGQIDDSIVIALLLRARAAGFQAWVLPQDPRLPMANRREDILVERP